MAVRGKKKRVVCRVVHRKRGMAGQPGRRWCVKIRNSGYAVDPHRWFLLKREAVDWARHYARGWWFGLSTAPAPGGGAGSSVTFDPASSARSTRRPAQLIVCGKNGRIQYEHTYGRDPRRTKG